jgi:hypothetical protein
MALYQMRRYDDAIVDLIKTNLVKTLHHAYLAASSAMAGQRAQAAEQMALYRAECPRSTLAFWAAVEPYKDQVSLNHLLDGLRKARLPV